MDGWVGESVGGGTGGWLDTKNWDVAQWYSIFLAIAKPWVIPSVINTKAQNEGRCSQHTELCLAGETPALYLPVWGQPRSLLPPPKGLLPGAEAHDALSSDTNC